MSRPRTEQYREDATVALNATRSRRGQPHHQICKSYYVREFVRQGEDVVSCRWVQVTAETAFAACHIAAQRWGLSLSEWAGENPVVLVRAGLTLQEAR